MASRRSHRCHLVLSVVVLAVGISGCSGTGQPAPQMDGRGVSMDAVAARAAHTSTLLEDGRTLVVGGCVTDGCAIATDGTVLIGEEGLNALTGPHLAQPRSSHTATSLGGGRVAIVGGFLGEGAGVTGTIEVFDAGTGAMTTVGSLDQPRGGHAAARLSDDRVLVVGGWISPGRYTSTVEIVDPATGSVSPAPPLPWAADALEATHLPDGRVLVTGGQVSPGEGTARSAVFDPDTGEWSAAAPMAAPRLKHFAVLLDDGRVLIGGGTSDDRILLSSTEVFDAQSDSFADGPQLLEGRYKLPGGAVALPGARVLVAGGGRAVEIVDVARGLSERLVELGERASFATVTLLPNHHALILGGYDDQIDLIGLNMVVRVPDQATAQVRRS